HQRLQRRVGAVRRGQQGPGGSTQERIRTARARAAEPGRARAQQPDHALSALYESAAGARPPEAAGRTTNPAKFTRRISSTSHFKDRSSLEGTASPVPLGRRRTMAFAAEGFSLIGCSQQVVLTTVSFP